VPADLGAAIERQTAYALAHGALRPIESTLTPVEDGGVRFAIRVATNLVRKDAEQRAADAAAPRNPFLPYEADLFVADLSTTHVALLNKFNVIDQHLLIVTRRFEPQEALLDAADFAALVAVLRAIDGLGFYNGGAVAGASQPHKHLQVVPLPLGDIGPPVPVEAVLDGMPGLRFRHAWTWLDLRSGSLDEAAHAALGCYRALLRTAGIGATEVAGVAHQAAPYNLLVTRRWMMVVPRTAERVEGISVNALGFAGSFFVRDAAQLQTLVRLGPMTAIERVSVAR
jgi:sulfate adenylyltransferase (ADP) / ATP adenylyltransferase